MTFDHVTNEKCHIKTSTKNTITKRGNNIYQNETGAFLYAT